MTTKAVLTPGKIGTLELKNRFYMSPMGTGYPTIDGYVTDQLVDYLAERAKGGFGLVGMEFTAVTASGQPPTLACVYDDSYLPGLTKVATAIKANGGKALLQLAHTAVAKPSACPQKGRLWLPPPFPVQLLAQSAAR